MYARFKNDGRRRGGNRRGIMQYNQRRLNHGYTNRVLSIDLGSGEIRIPDILSAAEPSGSISFTREFDPERQPLIRKTR
jgi:hypothetical protein